MSCSQVSTTDFQTSFGPHIPRKTKRRRLRKVNSCHSEPVADRTLVPSQPRNEWLLVQQGLSGDSSTLDPLFSAYTARLYRTAFAILHNKEDAEDAVQTGLCRACANLRSFQGRSSFSTWLTRIIINAALMLRRRNHVHFEASLDEILATQPERVHHGIVDTRPGPEETCSVTEIKEHVDAQVRRLPPGLRSAFQLCELDGLSPADSIQALGVSMSAFKSRISRARRKVAHGLRRSLVRPRELPETILRHDATLEFEVTL